MLLRGFPAVCSSMQTVTVSPPSLRFEYPSPAWGTWIHRGRMAENTPLRGTTNPLITSVSAPSGELSSLFPCRLRKVGSSLLERTQRRIGGAAHRPNEDARAGARPNRSLNSRPSGTTSTVGTVVVERVVPNELASATSQTQAYVNVRRTELGVIVVEETQIMTQPKL